jgi:hypothetical protein
VKKASLEEIVPAHEMHYVANIARVGGGKIDEPAHTSVT